ncbi:Hypothetical predicted protein [Octopus vulgaris]|nr:Hypothetical predicted protein [Octopus vulgaris]
MATWDEINELRANFARIQSVSSHQKLSEKNVVEVVSKLLELKLIDVIYTTDGKEYLTLQHLDKEILDELYVHGGRINLTDLKNILCVDFSHIESRVNELIKTTPGLSFVLGQLINSNYKEYIAEEIDEKLQERGHVLLTDLVLHYDLPKNFITLLVQQNIGGTIKGHLDTSNKDVLYTELYVSRIRAQVRGLFSAITKPTSLYNVRRKHNFQDQMFYSIVEELVGSGRLNGSITGQREKGTYHPNIFVRTQNQWVEDFYVQNGYLEYDNLARLGITNAKDFVKKMFKDEQLIYLSTCCVSVSLKEQVEASVEEALNDGSWIDISMLVPSVFNVDDIKQLLSIILSKSSNAFICCDSIAVSNKLVSECKIPFSELMRNKAIKDSKSNTAVFKVAKKLGSSMKNNEVKEDKRDSRKKKGGSKGGGGGGGASSSQAREVKTKVTKKKYCTSGSSKGGNEDSDEEVSGQHKTLSFMEIDEIEEILKKEKKLLDSPEELVTEIATQLYRPLSQEYQEMAKTVFFESTGIGSTSARKKTFAELQEKVCGMWMNILLIEKGIKLFSETVQTVLIKHMLKSICTDITNLITSAVAVDHMLSLADETQVTPDVRNNVIAKLPEPQKSQLKKLNSSLNSKSLEDFHESLNIICSPENLGILLRKPDRKKERQLLQEHRQTLIAELSSEDDPANALHLAVMILFQTFTNTFIHAPGRCVPRIIEFLEDYMAASSWETLRQFQDLVIKDMKSHNEDEHEEIIESNEGAVLEELLPELKDIAVATKPKEKQTKESSP